MDSIYSQDEKTEHTSFIKEQLVQLKDKIGQLKCLEVHTNSPEAPETNYDIILDTTFDSINSLNEYQEHPEHKKVVAALSKIKKQRAAIDYEF